MRSTTIAGFCVLVLAAAPVPAPAAVTLGQLDSAPTAMCGNGIDAFQADVSGASYRAPGVGTITSWSTNARAAPGQSMGLKAFNKIADPDVFRVVGQDGPRALSATGGLHTFPTSIPVSGGDLLGIITPPGGGFPSCSFAGLPSDLVRFRLGNTAPGGTANYDMTDVGTRLNLTATFVPSNSFTVGRTSRNKKKGSATVELTVPNPGELSASGNGVSATGASGARSAVSVLSGVVRVTIRAAGKKRKKLNRKGKAKLSVALTYTPNNGDPRTQSLQVKLKRKLKRR